MPLLVKSGSKISRRIGLLRSFADRKELPSRILLGDIAVAEVAAGLSTRLSNDNY